MFVLCREGGGGCGFPLSDKNERDHSLLFLLSIHSHRSQLNNICLFYPAGIITNTLCLLLVLVEYVKVITNEREDKVFLRERNGLRSRGLFSEKFSWGILPWSSSIFSNSRSPVSPLSRGGWVCYISVQRLPETQADRVDVRGSRVQLQDSGTICKICFQVTFCLAVCVPAIEQFEQE